MSTRNQTQPVNCQAAHFTTALFFKSFACIRERRREMSDDTLEAGAISKIRVMFSYPHKCTVTVQIQDKRKAYLWYN